VLLLLDDHLGTDQIAKQLFISEHTVRSPRSFGANVCRRSAQPESNGLRCVPDERSVASGRPLPRPVTAEVLGRAA
jgi:hypothetical protein